MTTIVMLGPQRLRPTLHAHVEALGLDPPIAAITAGWLQAEAETAELDAAVGSQTLPLELYARAERCFEEDPDLFQAHRERQRRLERLQALYRRRLDHAVGAVRELEVLGPRGEAEGADLLAGELEDALEAVRALDRHHQERVRSVQREFDEQARPTERESVIREQREIEARLADASAVVIAGGHVAVLLTRLRLFGLARTLAEKTILAVSAGAMVLAPRIVLFHDSPPWGAGNAEVLDDGLRLPFADRAPAIQPFPHARRRLRLEDRTRVSLLSRRFAPSRCIGMNEESWLRIETQAGAARPWIAGGVDLLLPSGEVESVEPEAPTLASRTGNEGPSR